MTPYTSFLADERNGLVAQAPKGNGTIVMDKNAKDAIDDLTVVEGGKGQIGAMNRQVLTTPTDRWRRRRVTAGPGQAQRSDHRAAPVAGEPGQRAQTCWATLTQIRTSSRRSEHVATVQNVGNQVLYRRGNLWVTTQTAQVDLKKDQAKVKVIERFSKEYFNLVHANTNAENQVLSAQGENDELLVDLRGQVYQIK